MHPDIKANFSEKLKLTVSDLIGELNNDFKAMVNLHASQGRLGSGDTIKKTMEFMSKANSSLFQVAIDHISSLNLNYSPKLENDIEILVSTANSLLGFARLDYFRDIKFNYIYRYILSSVCSG